MLQLKCKIEILSKDTQKTLIMEYCNAITVSTSLSSLTDTATITLPSKVHARNSNALLRECLSVGDTISVQMGYHGYNQERVFDGYIAGITSQNNTIVLSCENKMWKLKRIRVNPKRYAHFNIKDFLGEYIKDLDIQTPEDISFGEVIINEESTVSKILDYLQQQYPVRFSIKGKSLYVLLVSAMTSIKGKEINIKIGANSILDSLVYTAAKEKKVQIIAKHIKTNNELLQVTVGDEGGDVYTVYIPGVRDINELRSMAEQKHKQYEQDSVSGTITLFGIPYITKGDKIKIQDDTRTEFNNKRFSVEQVQYNFSASGYRQIINLGGQIR